MQAIDREDRRQMLPDQAGGYGGVLGNNHHERYLWERNYSLVNECSSLTWLFESQALY